MDNRTNVKCNVYLIVLKGRDDLNAGSGDAIVRGKLITVPGQGLLFFLFALSFLQNSGKWSCGKCR